MFCADQHAEGTGKERDFHIAFKKLLKLGLEPYYVNIPLLHDDEHEARMTPVACFAPHEVLKDV